MSLKMVQYDNACGWDGVVTIPEPMDDTWRKLIGFTSTTVLPFGNLFLYIRDIKKSSGLLHVTLCLTLRW